MIRAVIDTNVLVSAMISSRGNEALVIIAIHQGLLIPYFSAEILEEYREVLLRPRFGFLAEEAQALVNLLQYRGALLNPPPILRIPATTSSSPAPWPQRLTSS